MNRVRAAGGRARRVTAARAAEGVPAPSPDGRLIAFVGEGDKALDIFTMRRGGGGQTNRTPSKGEFAPDWQPRP